MTDYGDIEARLAALAVQMIENATRFTRADHSRQSATRAEPARTKHDTIGESTHKGTDRPTRQSQRTNTGDECKHHSSQSADSPNTMTSFEKGSRINTSTDSGNNEIGDVEPSSVSSGSKRKHETSFIWGYVTRVDVDGVKKVKCNFCEKLLVASQGTRTSSLKRHVEKCLSKHQATTDQTNTLFDPNVGKAKVAKMIIMHELSLRFVEYTGFREMMEYCQPRFESMSRNTLKSEIFKLYIRLTTDMDRPNNRD
ncbi:hypothetical protein EZV62_002263 [Acer yangbiense]|uniref:BED-type domain-containing protein n=1 Tax=Acer yangbiense TaxID=1000413 RepID=A0A5C7IXS1_9ROSI|nr:hypothetical protein EZV62_002263 [Acer yangbiense]